MYRLCELSESNFYYVRKPIYFKTYKKAMDYVNKHNISGYVLEIVEPKNISCKKRKFEKDGFFLNNKVSKTKTYENIVLGIKKGMP